MTDPMAEDELDNILKKYTAPKNISDGHIGIFYDFTFSEAKAALRAYTTNKIIGHFAGILDKNNITERVPLAKTNSKTGSSYQPCLINRSTINTLASVVNEMLDTVEALNHRKDKDEQNYR